MAGRGVSMQTAEDAVPPRVTETRAFQIRDSELIARLDAFVDEVRRNRPGRQVSRESVTRELLYAALSNAEVRRVFGG